MTRIGDVYRVLFNGVLETTNQPLMTAAGAGGATAVINAIYGLTVVNDLQAAGTGFSNAGGALRSVSGINFYTGRVGLGDAQSPALGSVGADRDLRPGHDSPTAEYFDNDHSLTVTGTITNTLINPPPVSTLVKMGDWPRHPAPREHVHRPLGDPRGLGHRAERALARHDEPGPSAELAALHHDLERRGRSPQTASPRGSPHPHLRVERQLRGRIRRAEPHTERRHAHRYRLLIRPRPGSDSLGR